MDAVWSSHLSCANVLYPVVRSSVSLAHPSSEQVQLYMMCVCVCVCVCVVYVCVGLTDSDSGVKMCGLHFQTVAVFLCPLAMRVTILMFPTILRLCHFMSGQGAGSRPTAPGSPPLATGCAPLSTVPLQSLPWCTSSWDLAAKPVGQTGGIS